ncbi:MAG: hypothetical protein ACI4RN_06540 [Oscillospiraceae bacterium]
MTLTFFKLLLFFYIYCFLGWCIESAIVSVSSRKFVNRGFLRGPVLPIYGSGAMLILLITYPVKVNWILVYFVGMIGTTVLEYITGWGMEKILHMRYWDYSDNRCNLDGYICLKSSLFWGLLSLFLVYVLHPPLERLLTHFSITTLIILDTVITFAFISDLVYAIRTAIDVNKILEALTKIKKDLESTKAELSLKLSESDAAIRLNQKLEKLSSDRKKLTEKLDYFKRDFILAHPTARSNKFNDALNEIRKEISSRRKR